MKRLSVLIVQPHKRTADRIVEEVEAVGHSTSVVRDGERAIDAFVQQPTDALIIDIALPGRDAEATVESIRVAPGGDRVAIILTGSRNKRKELQEISRRVHAIAGILRSTDIGSIPELLARIGDDGPTRTTGRGPSSALVEGDSEVLHWKKGDDPEGENEGLDVEKRAALVSEGVDNIHGDFSELPFARLLTRLGDARASGALVAIGHDVAAITTTGETPKKVVFFRNGIPSYVRSNLVQECLGQVVFRMGLIDKATLDESIRRVREGDGRRQGGILLAMGEITPHQLREALEQQLRAKLFDLFAWTQGSFQFSEEMTAPPETVTLEMSLSDILLRGITNKIPPPRLLRLLQVHLDAFVRPDHERVAPFLNLDLAPEARRAIGAMDGTQRLRQLLSLAEPKPGAAAQVIYALECAGAIQYSSRAEFFAPIPEAARPPESARSRAKREERDTVQEHYDNLPRPRQESVRTEVASLEVVQNVLRGEARTVPNPDQRAPNEHSLSNKTVSLDFAALDERVNKIFHAERYFHRGEKALTNGHVAEAITAFEQACGLCPEEGEFLAHLAYARHVAYPDDEVIQEGALADVNRAVLLSPKIDVVHVLQAKLLRARGDLVGARNAYQHALAANPDASEALAGLRELT